MAATWTFSLACLSYHTFTIISFVRCMFSAYTYFYMTLLIIRYNLLTDGIVYSSYSGHERYFVERSKGPRWPAKPWDSWTLTTKPDSLGQLSTIVIHRVRFLSFRCVAFEISSAGCEERFLSSCHWKRADVIPASGGHCSPFVVTYYDKCKAMQQFVGFFILSPSDLFLFDKLSNILSVRLCFGKWLIVGIRYCCWKFSIGISRLLC